MNTTPVLEITGLTQHFGGLRAVSDFNVRLGPNELVGLIGPNGAGKTTVFNLITGIYKPDKGAVVFDSKSLVGKRPHAIAAAGIDLDHGEGVFGQLDVVLRQAVEGLADAAAQASLERVCSAGRCDLAEGRCAVACIGGGDALPDAADDAGHRGQRA